MTKTIRVPREKVAEYFSKPELYFSVHSKYYKSFRVVSSGGNTAFVEEEWDIGGRRLNFTHKITLDLPSRIDFDIVEGDGRGSKETIVLEQVPEGTKVTYLAASNSAD